MTLLHEGKLRTGGQTGTEGPGDDRAENFVDLCGQFIQGNPDIAQGLGIEFPEQLAETLASGVMGFFQGLSAERPDAAAVFEQMRQQIKRGKFGGFDDVVGTGEAWYKANYLPGHPDANPSLMGRVLSSKVRSLERPH